MKRLFALWLGLLLTVTVLGGASLAMADDSLTGEWAGTWTCPGGEKTEGPLGGNIKQDGENVSGQFTMKGTVEGDLTGSLTGTASGGNISGEISGDPLYVELNGHYDNNSMSGTYTSSMGNGQFNLKRR